MENKDGGKYLLDQFHKKRAFAETAKFNEHISYLKSGDLLI